MVAIFILFFETIKSPDSDYYLALGTQDTRAYIAHRNNEFYYPFHFKKTKNEEKKVNTGQTIHHVEEMIFTDLSVRLLRSRTTFWTSFVSDRRWKSFLTF